ncbi:hypothetical protein OHS59_01355 [Streptomyces sp. NBC_00414]
MSNILAHAKGTERFHHQVVGDLTLDHVVLTVKAGPASVTWSSWPGG